jgi:hypothetical protein
MELQHQHSQQQLCQMAALLYQPSLLAQQGMQRQVQQQLATLPTPTHQAAVQQQQQMTMLGHRQRCSASVQGSCVSCLLRQLLQQMHRVSCSPCQRLSLAPQQQMQL